MLSKSAQTVQDALSAKGLEIQVLELPASTRTAEDAAKAIGCQAAQIAKSLIFRSKNGHKPILVLASGINRVNEKTIATHVGEEIIKADADFTREVTGFAIGGIPPIGHKQKIETYIDQDLLNHQELWAAAGTPNSVFRISSSQLVEITEGQIIFLAK